MSCLPSKLSFKFEVKDFVRCRFCFQHSEGEKNEFSSRDIAQVLHRTFNIKVSPVKNEEVCNKCVRRLRDAKEFKELVKRSEERQLGLMSARVIKIEPKDDSIDIDEHDFLDSECYSPKPTPKEEDVKPPIAAVFVSGHSSKEPQNKRKAVPLDKLFPRPGIAIKPLSRKINETSQRKMPMLTVKTKQVAVKPTFIPNKCKPLTPSAASRLKIKQMMNKCLLSLAKKDSKEVTIKKITNPASTVKVIKGMNSSGTPNIRMIRGVKSSETNIKSLVLLDDKKESRKQMRRNVFRFLFYTTATPFLNSRGAWKCLACMKIFTVYDQLHSHYAEVHPDPAKALYKLPPIEDLYSVEITDLKCRKCSKPFSDVQSAKEHLNSEHNIGLNLNQKNDVIQFKLFNIEGYKCHLCPKQYYVFRNLTQHMNEHFPNVMCEVCGKGFISERRYNTHIVSHVTGNFPCSKCGKVYPTLNKLNSHEVTHRATKYSCPQCSMKFVRFNERMDHLTQVHQVVHKMVCQHPNCGMEFSNFAAFKSHKVKHRLKIRRYACDVCGMTFYCKNSFTKHSITHTGETPFECKICNKKYNRKSTLDGHLRIHANDRRHVCSECGMSFVQKCSLKGHMKTRHPNVEWVP